MSMTKVVIEPRRKGRNGTQSMLIPTLDMVAERIAAVQKGETGSLAEVRTSLAEKYGADACCPVTVQRHVVSIAARVAAALAAGNIPPDEVTPFWRVVDPARPNARRLAGGPDFIRARLASER
jgi:hypothetical protein